MCIRDRVDGICDLCGAPLTVRKDDAPETVKNRLKVFHAETEPLKDFYKKPVSYTHLDVYKRQADTRWTPFFSNWCL